jgi:hypothetical protein
MCFKRTQQSIPEPEKKTLKTLKKFDDVIIEYNGQRYPAWVMEMSTKHFDLCVDLGNDFEFRKIFFKRNTDDSVIVSDIHTVYL